MPWPAPPQGVRVSAPAMTTGNTPKAMTWYGWGSPVGAGLFLVGLGAFLVLARYALAGL